MGTRNLTAVYLDGQYKVAQYGQWDGYPEGQGITVLTFLRDKMDLELFKEAFLRGTAGSARPLWPRMTASTSCGIWRRITGITVSGWQQSGTWTRFRPMRNFLPHSKMMRRRKRLRFNG